MAITTQKNEHIEVFTQYIVDSTVFLLERVL